MKTIYVMRHAKSSWDERGLADHERPLNERGRKAAALMARYMDREGIRPDLILCSSAVRTRATLEPLLLVLDQAGVSIEKGLFGAGADALFLRLQMLDEPAGSVLLIAHNPGAQELVLALAAGGPDIERVRAKFPTAGLATLTADLDSWSALKPRSAALKSFVTPKNLNAS